MTEIPGTTRDALEAVIDSGKWPLRLVDTAGLRETDDRIERLGIEVSERYLADAQVVLACAEDAGSIAQTTTQIRLRSEASIIPVRTKADLVTNGAQMPPPTNAVVVSAEKGSGLRELVEAIDSAIEETHGKVQPDLPILTNVRQRRALDLARAEVGEFSRTWLEESLPVTVAAVHVRAAISELEELIGTLEVEDVLERVFSSFCVGK